MRLLIGTDSDYAATLRAANEMHQSGHGSPLLVLLGTDTSFSFRPRPSTILVPGMPAGVIAAVPALEEFGIASRLASEAGLPGCHDGPVTELAELWLKSLQAPALAQVEVTVSSSPELACSVQELGNRLALRVSVLP